SEFWCSSGWESAGTVEAACDFAGETAGARGNAGLRALLSVRGRRSWRDGFSGERFDTSAERTWGLGGSGATQGRRAGDREAGEKYPATKNASGRLGGSEAGEKTSGDAGTAGWLVCGRGAESPFGRRVCGQRGIEPDWIASGGAAAGSAGERGDDQRRHA